VGGGGGGGVQLLNLNHFALPINAVCRSVSEQIAGYCLLCMSQAYQISWRLDPYYDNINITVEGPDFVPSKMAASCNVGVIKMTVE
jgi:hypothetical protein